jgi:hypothetical protein
VIDDESLVKTRTNICLSDASAVPSYSVSIYRRATYVGNFEVSVLAHVAIRMLAAIFLASQ